MKKTKNIFIYLLIFTSLLIQSYVVNANSNAFINEKASIPITVSFGKNVAGFYHISTGQSGTIGDPINSQYVSSATVYAVFTPTKLGNYQIVVSFDVSDSSANEVSVANKTVNVNVINRPTQPTKPSTPSTPVVPQTPIEVKSKDSSLKSLTISKGTLNPEFNPDTLEYNVLLPKENTSLNVSAEVNDAKASVRNTGEHKLAVGENDINITVTPEEGSERVYKINVYVEDEPKHKLDYNDFDFDVIEHFIGANVPDTFEETKLKIEGQEVVGLHSNLWNTDLLYLSDSDNNRDFYVVSEEEGKLKVISKFELIGIFDDEFLLLDVPDQMRDKVNLKYTDVTIGNQTMMGFKYVDPKLSNYSIIYVRNKDGENVFYQYEEKDNSYQLYIDNIALSEDEYNKVIDDYDENIKIMWMGIGALGVVSVSMLGILVSLAAKNKKLKSH